MMRWICLLMFVLSFHGVVIAQQKPATEGVIHPQEIESYRMIERLPVLDNGRIKPLDTYARSTLLQFSGRQSYNRKPAIVWLVRLLFAPDETKSSKIFLINHPSIARSLGIASEPHRRYSFQQLEPALDKFSELAHSANEVPEKERDVVEAELIRVFNNVRMYIDLSHVFQFAFPAKDFVITDPALKSQLGLAPEQEKFSFLEIALSADQLKTFMEAIQRKDQSQWSTQERTVIDLVSNLFQWSGVYQNLPLNIVPDPGQAGVWRSPWDAIRQDFQKDQTRSKMKALGKMIESYWDGDQITFDLNTKLFLEETKKNSGMNAEKLMKHLDLELTYNKGDFFLYAKILYLVAFILFLLSLAVEKSWMYPAAFGCIALGLFPHVIAIALRVIILERPPVSSLYETFIFVSFVIVVIGVLIEVATRRWLGIVTASVGGFIVLMIAAKYSAEGDTLKMLIAVLNSNFWLSTHVISITAGYGSACAAGILGHVYLLQVVCNKGKEVLQSTYRTLLGVLGLGLTLTFLGTNLGGIWADQSWGRFWGWDPKENGALMIVLWIAMLFHAKIALWIKETGMAVGAVLGTIVVVWAWFGVNLLSIGLHSYGFTSGVATGTAVYVSFELIFLLTVLILINRKKSGAKFIKPYA
ncbi:MAG: cytochrome c biogenesis protein CcsA [Candidatus Omnitrophica bacterium]|nr:cytochrome c biogenesis protein CcsA [Candidatus Omnitrophota bacterium]